MTKAQVAIAEEHIEHLPRVVEFFLDDWSNLSEDRTVSAMINDLEMRGDIGEALVEYAVSAGYLIETGRHTISYQYWCGTCKELRTYTWDKDKTRGITDHPHRLKPIEASREYEKNYFRTLLGEKLLQKAGNAAEGAM